MMFRRLIDDWKQYMYICKSVRRVAGVNYIKVVLPCMYTYVWHVHTYMYPMTRVIIAPVQGLFASTYIRVVSKDWSRGLYWKSRWPAVVVS
jgi:hypothetical protein